MPEMFLSYASSINRSAAETKVKTTAFAATTAGQCDPHVTPIIKCKLHLYAFSISKINKKR